MSSLAGNRTRARDVSMSLMQSWNQTADALFEGLIKHLSAALLIHMHMHMI